MRLGLAAGVLLPFVYFVNLFGWAALTPGFDHASMMPSDAGRAGQPYAGPFNAGLIAVAALGLFAAVGLWFGFERIRAQMGFGSAAVLSLALGSFALGMAGAFPLPDPLHYGFGLNLATPFVPLFGAITVFDRARWVLLGCFAAQLLYPLAAIAGFVTDANVGLWIRAFAAVNFFALAVLCWTVANDARSSRS